MFKKNYFIKIGVESRKRRRREPYLAYAAPNFHLEPFFSQKIFFITHLIFESEVGELETSQKTKISSPKVVAVSFSRQKSMNFNIFS